jgi:hypothetical protein
LTAECRAIACRRVPDTKPVELPRLLEKINLLLRNGG